MPAGWEQDFYALLGVAKDASTDTITKSYRQLALKYHPDKNREHDTTSTFQQIGLAYDVLKDDDLRAKYDRRRATPQSSNTSQRTQWTDRPVPHNQPQYARKPEPYPQRRSMPGEAFTKKYGHRPPLQPPRRSLFVYQPTVRRGLSEEEFRLRDRVRQEMYRMEQAMIACQKGCCTHDHGFEQCRQAHAENQQGLKAHAQKLNDIERLRCMRLNEGIYPDQKEWEAFDEWQLYNNDRYKWAEQQYRRQDEEAIREAQRRQQQKEAAGREDTAMKTANAVKLRGEQLSAWKQQLCPHTGIWMACTRTAKCLSCPYDRVVERYCLTCKFAACSDCAFACLRSKWGKE